MFSDPAKCRCLDIGAIISSGTSNAWNTQSLTLFFLEKEGCLNTWMVQIIRLITVLFKGFVGKSADSNDG